MPATTIGEARKVPEVESGVGGMCMDRGHFSATAGRDPAHFFGRSHSKFAASFGSPLPLYFAACGYGHRGRVIFACVRSWPSNFDAIIIDGAVAFSTHCSKDAWTLRCGSSNFRSWTPTSDIGVRTAPNESGPGPPPQCCM